MADVAVSIGSNLERERSVSEALVGLREVFGELAISPVYESPAYGFEGPAFYNLVVVFETVLDVHAVRELIQGIEARRGRTRVDKRFDSRALDLDLLLYADAVLYDDGLDVPRREILEHAYILKPLADLLPERRHPVTGKSFAQIWVESEQKTAALSPVIGFDPG